MHYVLINLEGSEKGKSNEGSFIRRVIWDSKIHD